MKTLVISIGIAYCLLCACITSDKAKKKFVETILHKTKLERPVYVIVPVSLGEKKLEICIDNVSLYDLILINKSNPSAQESYLNRLREAVVFNRPLVLDTSENLSYLPNTAINDSAYAKFAHQSLREVKAKYFTRDAYIKHDVKLSQQEQNCLIKYLFEHQYIVGINGLSGYLYVIPPPHAIPEPIDEKIP